MTAGSLFTGIGAMDLGFRRRGIRVKWMCESDPYCRRVLARRWPNTPCYEDVRTLTDPPNVGILFGGFPCQDISRAGRRSGLAGERSGLWEQYARLIREVRPSYVVVENVTSLLVRGLDTVLGDLAACGYDAEWDCLPAAYFGAPHIRDRIFVVAYSSSRRHGASQAPVFAGRTRFELRPRRAGEPGVCRVDDGAASRVERIRALGNAVDMRVAEYVASCVIDHCASFYASLFDAA